MFSGTRRFFVEIFWPRESGGVTCGAHMGAHPGTHRRVGALAPWAFRPRNYRVHAAPLTALAGRWFGVNDPESPFEVDPGATLWNRNLPKTWCLKEFVWYFLLCGPEFWSTRDIHRILKRRWFECEKPFVWADRRYLLHFPAQFRVSVKRLSD
jgi:hypothetical protein